MSKPIALGALIGAASIVVVSLAWAAPQPWAAAFVHPRAFEVFGYYLPSSKPRVGPYQLDDLSMGGPEEFAAWEAGRRTRTYAPVMLEFSDVRSPMATNEQGQRYHTVRIRVLPDSYRVAPGFVEFRGHDARLGQVILSGGIDAAALARAKHSNMPLTVVQAGLEFRGQRTRNVSFIYFAGD